MRKTIHFLSLVVIFSGCATYNYYAPPVNSTLFAQQGEVHLSGNFGTGGGYVLGGVAVTNNISVTGMYGGGVPPYRSSEGDLGLAFNTTYQEGIPMFSLCAGYGIGSNSLHDSGAEYKSFYGNFTKPFIQPSIGFIGGHGQVFFAIQIDYMYYRGYTLVNNAGDYKSFNPNNLFYEPYVGGSIGGKHVRLEGGWGFSIKPEYAWGNGLLIFPLQFNMGLLILLNNE